MFDAYINDSPKTLVDPAKLRIFFMVVSAVKTYSKPLVFIKKTMNVSTSVILIILSKLFYWSTVVCLSNNVPLNGLLTILLTDVLMVVPRMVVPEVHANPTLHIVPLGSALLLVSLLNIEITFLQKLSTLSGLTKVEHLIQIVSTV